jgi:hypothetical protein
MSSLLEAKALDEEQAYPNQSNRVKSDSGAQHFKFEFSAELAHIRSPIEASYLQHLFNNLLV